MNKNERFFNIDQQVILLYSLPLTVPLFLFGYSHARSLFAQQIIPLFPFSDVLKKLLL